MRRPGGVPRDICWNVLIPIRSVSHCTCEPMHPVDSIFRGCTHINLRLYVVFILHIFSTF